MARFSFNDPPKRMNEKIVRGFPAIRKETLNQAMIRGSVARAVLAPHNANSDKYRKPGEMRSYIEVSSGTIVDAFVDLVAESSAAAGGINNVTGALDTAMRV